MSSSGVIVLNSSFSELLDTVFSLHFPPCRGRICADIAHWRVAESHRAKDSSKLCQQ